MKQNNPFRDRFEDGIIPVKKRIPATRLHDWREVYVFESLFHYSAKRLDLVRLFVGAAYDCFRSECGEDL